jgi:hypothetical protein
LCKKILSIFYDDTVLEAVGGEKIINKKTVSTEYLVAGKCPPPLCLNWKLNTFDIFHKNIRGIFS